MHAACYLRVVKVSLSQLVDLIVCVGGPHVLDSLFHLYTLPENTTHTYVITHMNLYLHSPAKRVPFLPTTIQAATVKGKEET